MNTATKLLKAPKTILLIMTLMAGIISEGTASSKEDANEAKATATFKEQHQLPQVRRSELPQTHTGYGEGDGLVLDNSEY